MFPIFLRSNHISSLAIDGSVLDCVDGRKVKVVDCFSCSKSVINCGDKQCYERFNMEKNNNAS